MDILLSPRLFSDLAIIGTLWFLRKKDRSVEVTKGTIKKGLIRRGEVAPETRGVRVINLFADFSLLHYFIWECWLWAAAISV
jgi:hypothetical protein